MISKIFKCPDCKHVRTVEANIIMIRCGCGASMEEVDSKHNPIDTRNQLEKDCDANECGSCPHKGVRCF